MKIIFLDIDGVLNSSDNWVHPDDREGDPNSLYWNLYDLDPERIKILNTIIQQTEAKIVISSAWRWAHSLESIDKMLKTRGLVGDIIGETPMLTSIMLDRGDEIKMWLDNNEDVDSFVIIDDIDFEGFSKLFPRHFVLVEDFTGILPKHAESAVAVLNK